jgi:uncharacterized protein involved in exopolysaccharide biosynthesis
MVGYQIYQNTAGVTKTHRSNMQIAERQYNALRSELNKIIGELSAIESKLEGIIPYTKDKGAGWKKD